MYPIYTYAT
jgi:glutaryl-CoA dehydrogenase